MAKYLDKAGVAYLLDRLHDIIEKVAIGDINLSDYVTKEELQKELEKDKIDITLSSSKTRRGSKHPINRIIEELEDLFVYNLQNGIYKNNKLIQRKELLKVLKTESIEK